MTGPEKDDIANKLSKAARTYFNSLVADGHSFSKPTFYLGLGDWSVTNILPDGAHARTPGRVELLPNGASGFSKIGDYICFALDVSCSSDHIMQAGWTESVKPGKISAGQTAVMSTTLHTQCC